MTQTPRTQEFQTASDKFATSCGDFIRMYVEPGRKVEAFDGLSDLIKQYSKLF